jgi:hypothetical protein
MKIHFERTGGFAGLKLRTTVDSESLPRREAERLERLLARSHFFELPLSLEGRTPGADRFHYRVTVESGGRTHTVRTSDAALPEELRPLVEWLAVRVKAEGRP